MGRQMKLDGEENRNDYKKKILGIVIMISLKIVQF